MREEDILVVREPALTPAERLYLPQVVEGVRTTLRHMFNVKKREETVTQYPEQKHE